MKSIILVFLLIFICNQENNAQGTWTHKSDFPGDATWGAVGFSIGDKGYIVTGAGTLSSGKEIWQYDQATDTWTQRADFGGNARYNAVGFSIGTKGYVGTGIDAQNADLLRDFWEYDPSGNTWSRKANFAGEARWEAVGFSIGNKGYIGAGRANGVGHVKDFWEYDPQSNIWTQKEDIGGPPRTDAVGFSIGDRGYVGTGWSADESLNDFWEYDPNSNSWSQKAKVGGPERIQAVGFSIGKKGYVGTGQSVDSSLRDFWEYDPHTNTWRKIADIPWGIGRWHSVCFVIGSMGYISTGFTEFGGGSNYLLEYQPDYQSNLAVISFLSDGPLSSEITVSKNGLGYAYFQMISDGVDLYHDDVFSVTLLSGNQSMSISARFLTPGVLRLDIPGTIFGESSEITFALPSSIIIGNTEYELTNDEISITASKQLVRYNRLWSIFAGGSAGVSGSLFGVGAGPSVAAVKASIAGHGAMGLGLRVNEAGHVIYDRSVEFGIGASLSVPSVNPVVGEVKAGIKASAMIKTMVGQRLNFSDLNLTDNERKMAQAGFLMETIAMGGLELSPTFGWVMRATINTLNTLGEIDHILNDALISEYWGMGLEGEISAGLSYEIEPVVLNAVGASIAGVFSFKNISNYRTVGGELAKVNALYSTVGTSFEVTLASNYDMSLLNPALKFSDDVELTSGNYGLFDIGAGGEISYIVNKNSDGVVDNISIGLTSGGDVNVFANERSRYFSSIIEIDGIYADVLKGAGAGIASLYTSGIGTPFGLVMVEEGIDAFITSFSNYMGVPIRVYTYETRGIGFNFNVGVDIDAALGVGVGLSLGVKGKYMDEIEFPRKIAEVYNNGDNYLLSTSKYDNQMENDDLQIYLNEMFSGLLPLIENSLRNLWNSVSEYVQAGVDVIINGYNAVAEFVGSVRGSVNKAGRFVVSIFSPESPRVLYKAFELPEVRYTYTSNEVYQAITDIEGLEQLLDTGTRLIIISESMNVGFIPEGQENTVDELDEMVTLSMVIKEEDLLKNDFTINDKDKIRIYYYDSKILGWVRKGGTIDVDTISVDITKMGTYSLGIELNLEADDIPPEIYEYGPMEGSIWDEYPNIYAKIRDDRYGSGIDLANTFILLNGDTLGISYNPTEEMIFYQISREDGLEAGEQSVTIVASDLAGNQSTLTFTFQLTATGVDGADELPKDYALLQNYPNPFNMSTTIQFQLPRSSNISINIYDVQGRYITTIFDGNFEAGTNEVVWDGTNSRGSMVSSGVYFYQLRDDNVNIVKKMSLVK